MAGCQEQDVLTEQVCFDKVDLLLVAPWFGLSAFSALMYPSTQVDKC